MARAIVSVCSAGGAGSLLQVLRPVDVTRNLTFGDSFRRAISFSPPSLRPSDEPLPSRPAAPLGQRPRPTNTQRRHPRSLCCLPSRSSRSSARRRLPSPSLAPNPALGPSVSPPGQTSLQPPLRPRTGPSACFPAALAQVGRRLNLSRPPPPSPQVTPNPSSHPSPSGARASATRRRTQQLAAPPPPPYPPLPSARRRRTPSRPPKPAKHAVSTPGSPTTALGPPPPRGRRPRRRRRRARARVHLLVQPDQPPDVRARRRPLGRRLAPVPPHDRRAFRTFRPIFLVGWLRGVSGQAEALDARARGGCSCRPAGAMAQQGAWPGRSSSPHSSSSAASRALRRFLVDSQPLDSHRR